MIQNPIHRRANVKSDAQTSSRPLLSHTHNLSLSLSHTQTMRSKIGGIHRCGNATLPRPPPLNPRCRFFSPLACAWPCTWPVVFFSLLFLLFSLSLSLPLSLARALSRARALSVSRAPLSRALFCFLVNNLAECTCLFC